MACSCLNFCFQKPLSPKVRANERKATFRLKMFQKIELSSFFWNIYCFILKAFFSNNSMNDRLWIKKFVKKSNWLMFFWFWKINIDNHNPLLPLFQFCDPFTKLFQFVPFSSSSSFPLFTFLLALMTLTVLLILQNTCEYLLSNF